MFSDKQHGNSSDNEKTDILDEIFSFTINCLQEFIFRFNIEGVVAYQLFDTANIFSLIDKHYTELSNRETTEVLDWIKERLLESDSSLQRYLC